MFKKIALLMFAALFLASSSAFAQEEQTMDEMLEFTFGSLVRVSDDQITILEYNFDEEKEIEVNYDVTPTTEYINIEGLAALEIGDEIEIEFKEDAGKRTVMAIAKDEDLPMEGDIDIEDVTGTEDAAEEATEDATEEAPQDEAEREEAL